MLNIYCEVWGLDINDRKTRVMIFSGGKIRIERNQYFKTTNIRVCTQNRRAVADVDFLNSRPPWAISLSLAEAVLYHNFKVHLAGNTHWSLND